MPIALPTHWVRLFAEAQPPTPGSAPLAAMLKGLLLSLEGDASLLTSLTDAFGRTIFWQLLRVVLLGHTAAILKLPPPSLAAPSALIPAQLTAQLQLLSSASACDTVSREGESGDETPLGKLYVSKASGLMKDLQGAGKDADKRCSVLRSLLQLAQGEMEAAKPAVFADLVPSLMKRLHTEQENVKFQVLPLLVDPAVFPPACWEAAYLAFLWHSCEHARNQSTRWQSDFIGLAMGLLQAALGFHMRGHVLEHSPTASVTRVGEEVWLGAAAAAEPCAARMEGNGKCVWMKVKSERGEDQASAGRAEAAVALEEQMHTLRFAAKVLLQTNNSDVFLDLYAAAQRAHAERGTAMSPAAAEWMLQHSLCEPEDLSAHTRALPSRLMHTLERAARGFGGDQRQAWEALPGLRKRWDAMLADAADLPVAELEVLLSGIVKQLYQHNQERAKEHEREQLELTTELAQVPHQPWWGPLEAGEYSSALGLALSRLSSSNVKPLTAMRACATRLTVLTRAGLTLPGSDHGIRKTVETAVSPSPSGPPSPLLCTPTP